MSDVEKKENSEKPQNKQYNNQKKGNYQNRGQQQDKRRVYMRRKICRFCADKSMVIDFKKPEILRRFTTEGGKIIPRRMSGNCAKHQRLLAKEIKRSRYMALLPYVKQ